MRFTPRVAERYWLLRYGGTKSCVSRCAQPQNVGRLCSKPEGSPVGLSGTTEPEGNSSRTVSSVNGRSPC